MYLKEIEIENVGPLERIKFTLPFANECPQPVVLVGPNGSGKSTIISLIVGALFGFQQQAFSNSEVQKQQVYRVRGTKFIRTGANWYHVELRFEGELRLVEWVIDRPRSKFETEVKPLPQDSGWKAIPINDFSIHELTPTSSAALPFPHHVPSQVLEEQFRKNVALYFPSDRSEIPDWLNQQALTNDVLSPAYSKFEGQTQRRILSDVLLNTTLQWIKALVLDELLHMKTMPYSFTLPSKLKERVILDFVGLVLARILGADNDRVTFSFTKRNEGRIMVEYFRSGKKGLLPDLMGLSAGQAMMFCTFCNVLRDFDLAEAQFGSTSDVRGIVVLDEADLHLHQDLQFRVFPELMKLFPRVQFILSTHSPVLLMGMQNSFGENGFQVREIPSGKEIACEEFSEFGSALAFFVNTNAFDRIVFDRIAQSSKPLLITEGKYDVLHLVEAWKRNYGAMEMPFEVVSCGSFARTNEDKGGAKMLRTMLHSFSLHAVRFVLGLFDYDEEGVNQFNSLKNDGFTGGTEPGHAIHHAKQVQAMLLPVPLGRESFVSLKSPRSCFLSLEHFYSDNVLDKFKLNEVSVAADSLIFRIEGNKAGFADRIRELPDAEFANFAPLFERIGKFLGHEYLHGCECSPISVGNPTGQSWEPVMVMNSDVMRVDLQTSHDVRLESESYHTEAVIAPEGRTTPGT